MIPTTESSLTQPEGVAPNPFQVPDLPQKSLRPLTPWKYPEHEGYYVKVDNTHQSYEEFERFLATPLEDLERGGRLVVVAGESGCGKTSLIHRCVDYIKREISPSPCAVVDLSATMDAMEPDNDSRAEPDQVRKYLDRLAHMVMTQLSEEYEDFEEPDAAIRPANSAYVKTSAQLKKLNGVAVIILPPFEDAVTAPGIAGARSEHPVRHYMNFRHPRMIFFAECLNADAVQHWHDRITSEAAREDALLLRVGPLDTRDGWRFAYGRIKKSEHAGVPTVTEQTMLDVVRDHSPMSLSQLQMLCHTVWDDAIRTPGTAEVTPDDIRRYYTDRASRFQPRSLPRNGQP